jgi:hypothetical protein
MKEMIMMRSEKVNVILSRGVSLTGIGVNNWVLTKSQAMQALCELEALGVPVLGGDVYELSDDGFSANYDNWYCDKRDDEEMKKFVMRSISSARQYIKDYVGVIGRDVYFSLVTENQSV